MGEAPDVWHVFRSKAGNLLIDRIKQQESGIYLENRQSRDRDRNHNQHSSDQHEPPQERPFPAQNQNQHERQNQVKLEETAGQYAAGPKFFPATEKCERQSVYKQQER